MIQISSRQCCHLPDSSLYSAVIWQLGSELVSAATYISATEHAPGHAQWQPDSADIPITYNACNNYYMIITCYQHPIILKIELDLAITTIYKHAKNNMATY